MKKSQGSPAGVGVLTVLTVLLVLILAVCAALAYQAARADLALSQTNADTVSAYYAVDAQAARLAAQFRAGEEEELEVTLPMTETQSLYLHLVRVADGTVRTLAWKTVPVEGATGEETGLPVYDGTHPIS